jgi:hypothetical protein
MKLKILITFILFAVCVKAQNVGINTTGAAPASTNMFEVLQPSTTASSVGIFSSHTGAITGTGFGLWSQKTGASTTNVGGYFSASGATNNYGLIVPSGGGNIGFGTTTPGASALLELSSTTQGLLAPRMTSTQRTAISSPATGLLVYQTDASTQGIGFYFYNGSAWVPFSTNNGGWGLRGNTGITPPATPVTYGTSTFGATENFLGTTDAQPLTLGTNNRERMRILSSGFIGIGTAAPSMLLDVRGTTTTNSESVLRVTSAGASGSVNAIYGISASTDGTGVYGFTSASSGSNNGVVGEITDGTGNGVKGIAGSASDNSSTGVWGINNSTTTGAGVENFGVLGTCKGAGATSASHYGTFGDAAGGTSNFGAYGKATGAGTLNYGGFFTASGATSNYGLIVPNGGGSIGFGTSSPSFLLDIRGSASSDLIYGSNTGTGDVFRGIANAAVQYACFFGNNSPLSSGSGYSITNSNAGIQGQINNTRDYSFGVFGNGGDGFRSGGVLGSNSYPGGWGCLGYRTSGGGRWALYYSNDGTLGGVNTGTGKEISDNLKLAYGLGIGGYASLLGGFVRGDLYGMLIKGDRIGMYIDGKTFSNHVYAVVLSGEHNKKTVVYTQLNDKPSLSFTGRTKLNNGECFIFWSDCFVNNNEINEENVNFSLTPLGNCKGLYIAEINKKGFLVKELMEGNSNVSINYTVILINFNKNESAPEEILDIEFDNNIKAVMQNENDPKTISKGMYWDGTKLIFDNPPENPLIEKAVKKLD